MLYRLWIVLYFFEKIFWTRSYLGWIYTAYSLLGHAHKSQSLSFFLLLCTAYSLLYTCELLQPETWTEFMCCVWGSSLDFLEELWSREFRKFACSPMGRAELLQQQQNILKLLLNHYFLLSLTLMLSVLWLKKTWSNSLNPQHNWHHVEVYHFTLESVVILALSPLHPFLSVLSDPLAWALMSYYFFFSFSVFICAALWLLAWFSEPVVQSINIFKLWV